MKKTVGFRTGESGKPFDVSRARLDPGVCQEGWVYSDSENPKVESSSVIRTHTNPPKKFVWPQELETWLSNR